MQRISKTSNYIQQLSIRQSPHKLSSSECQSSQNFNIEFNSPSRIARDYVSNNIKVRPYKVLSSWHNVRFPESIVF